MAGGSLAIEVSHLEISLLQVALWAIIVSPVALWAIIVSPVSLWAISPCVSLGNNIMSHVAPCGIAFIFQGELPGDQHF